MACVYTERFLKPPGRLTCSGAFPKTVIRVGGGRCIKEYIVRGIIAAYDMDTQRHSLYLRHTPAATAVKEMRRLWPLIKADTNRSRVFKGEPLNEALLFYLPPSLSFKCTPLQFIEFFSFLFFDSLRENSVHFPHLNLILLFLLIFLFLGEKAWLEFLCL